MAVTWLIFTYTTAALLFIGGLAWYYERRTRLALRRPPLRAYHCVRCGQVYGSRSPGERGDCPHCGFSNISLRF